MRYKHFYYFSTPLKRWYAFRSLLRRAHVDLSPPWEHRILRVLDWVITVTGYRARRVAR